ncbi:unnamed protein product [Sphagnum tenellum]
MTVRFNDLEQMEGMNSSWIRDLEVGTSIEDRPIFPLFAQLETTNGSWIRDLESWQPIEDRPIFRYSNSSRETAWIRDLDDMGT